MRDAVLKWGVKDRMEGYWNESPRDIMVLYRNHSGNNRIAWACAGQVLQLVSADRIHCTKAYAENDSADDGFPAWFHKVRRKARYFIQEMEK